MPGMADAPRLLHRHSPNGYTTNPAKALYLEPEAVAEVYQQKLSERARLDAHDQLLVEWLKTSNRITSALDHFTPFTRHRDDLRSPLRALSRQCERITQRLER
jgi:hypothetical protein